jgi:sigma-B regulation protein RsbU (phosphoserine phosphatase)
MATPGGEKTKSTEEPSLPGAVLRDLFRKDHKRKLSRDLHDLYVFYLDEDRQARLAGMHWFKRTLFLLWWLLKGLVLKLSPTRRILLVISIALFFLGGTSFVVGSQWQVQVNATPFAFLIVLVILMLELKDKLLARDELEVGRAVQLALMPAEHPKLEGWEIWIYTRPANDVGGDLVDYLRQSDGRLHLALGDVAGKGLGAALLMAKLQSTLRALATTVKSLTELARGVNRILCRDGLPGRFATLLYLEASPGSGRLKLVNAGHMPPLVVDGSRIHSLPPVAMPLGFLPDAVYIEQTLEVEPGEFVLLYSDGLTEAHTSDWEFFGEERLRDYLKRLPELSAANVGEHILRKVNAFVGEAPLSDDISLVVLKRD